MKRILPIILAVIAIAIVGCETNTTSTTRSGVARLTAFSFSSNDAYPGLAEASFTVEERLDTGLVYNPDSIRFGTPLDSVVPRFTFAATPGSATMQTPDTTIVLSGTDTINFTQGPIYLSVTSANGENTKVYEIRATVHTVDPDLFQWERLTERIYPADNSEQQVLLLGDRFVLIKDNGWTISCYTSTDAIQWSTEQRPTGLPDDCYVRSIISDNTTLYYASGTTLYTSTDALTWTATDYTDSGFTFRAMLLAWNNTVWAVGEQDGRTVLLTMQDGRMTPTDLYPATDFPVSDFAAVAFASASQRERAMILGGYAADGTSLNTRWNLEYSPTITSHGGYRMQDFSIDRPAFDGLTGVSVVWYNNQLYMFGGVDEDMQYIGRDILVSTDEGLTWTAADSAKNYLPETYTARQKQSVLMRDNYIYIFGGESQTVTYSDVYRGKLNSIDW